MSATGNPDPGNSMDYVLIMDMMEYFCFAIKPTGFSGSMTFVFYDEVEGDTIGVKGQQETEFEVTVTIEKVEAASDKPPGEKDPPRPRVVVRVGGPPEGALSKAKGRARVSYKQFLLIYSGKASARDIISMALQRKIQLTGFAASMKFGFSFEYNKPTWTAYYSAKAKTSLREEEDEVAADQSRSQNASGLRCETLGTMSPKISPRDTSVAVAPCKSEREIGGEGMRVLEGSARKDYRHGATDASVNRVVFSSDRFRTTGKRRKQERQENDERPEHEEDAAVVARGTDGKDSDEDEDEGTGSDRHSEGGSGGYGACGGGGRGAKQWVHMSLASWIRRLKEGVCALGEPFGTAKCTCCHYFPDDATEPALLCVRGNLNPSSSSWLPLTKNTSITRGVFLPGIGVGVKRRRLRTSDERCWHCGCYRHRCAQQHNQLLPSVFLRRYLGLQTGPHSIGGAVLCAERDFYGLVHSLPQLRPLTSPYMRPVNGNHAADSAFMSSIMTKPTSGSINGSRSKENAFRSSRRELSSSRQGQRDSANGSNSYDGGGSDKGSWGENRPSVVAAAGGATAGTAVLLLVLCGSRGCGVGACNLRRRLPHQFPL